ncbi:hypothetical protein CVT25_015643 [Psilocybe cyanescens]|uniref:Uncharacterized protein n=1 Tax=Psilocybe cyanescens TaxID=93625 RepID=A0A409WHX6_PSICY|nr:hypothetical protein CVT25_015643 [Psilocybe cyanescens]
MFVAIASRTGTLATEFSDILHQIISCTNRLISITMNHQDVKAAENSIPKDQPMELDDTDSLLVSTSIGLISMQQEAARSVPVVSRTTHNKAASPPIMLEKKMVHQTRIEFKQPPEPAPLPKKKKRKVPRNEIDDIFGF